MIIHLKNLVNQLLDAFIDTKKVTKLYILAINVIGTKRVYENKNA